MGRNLRSLIQELVVATREPSFKPNSPETQTLLKNFATQAHNYQIAAKAAGKKFTKAEAEANIKKNNAAAAANRAAAAAAAEVESAAGKAEQAANEAGKGNISKVGLLNRLKTAKNKAVASVKTFIASKPAAPLAPTAERIGLPHLTFNKAENYFKTQPSSNRVAANKLQAGAKKRLLGGWNYGVNNSRKATFWKGYNVLDKSLENMARTRNFTRYIPLGRNANKNIKKYPKYTQFFTNVKNLPGLNTRRNALLAQEVGILPNQIAAFNKSVDDLLKQYNKYKGYEPVGMSAGQLWERTAGHKARLQSNANRTVFKGLANKGPAEYRLAKRNVASNRKAYGTDPEFKKFWANYNKSEAAIKLGAAMSAAIEAANKAAAVNISVTNANTYAKNAALAARDARAAFNKTNRSSSVYKSHLGTANAASKRAQASLAAAKKRNAEAAAKTAANAKAAAKAVENAQKAEAARVAANAKAVENKVKAIAKALANLLSMRNSANAQAKKGDVEGVTKLKNSANKLKNSVTANGSGATQEQKNNANKLATETAAYIDVAKHIKFIQEVWSRTRGSGAGNAWRVKKEVTPEELSQITRTYFNKNSLNTNNKTKIKELIPNNPVSGSIIGWRGGLVQRRDANYNSRKKYLEQILNINQTPAAPPPAPAAAPPPPPPGPIPGSRGALLLEPNKRGRPSTWTINQKFQNAYAKNNQNPANLFVKSNNGTYRKTNNNAGTFINANVYNWVPSAKNFVKR